MAAAYDVIGEIEAALLDKAGAENVETTKRTLSALIEIPNGKRAR